MISRLESAKAKAAAKFNLISGNLWISIGSRAHGNDSISPLLVTQGIHSLTPHTKWTQNRIDRDQI